MKCKLSEKRPINRYIDGLPFDIRKIVWKYAHYDSYKNVIDEFNSLQDIKINGISLHSQEQSHFNYRYYNNVHIYHWDFKKREFRIVAKLPEGYEVDNKVIIY